MFTAECVSVNWRPDGNCWTIRGKCDPVQLTDYSNAVDSHKGECEKPKEYGETRMSISNAF